VYAFSQVAGQHFRIGLIGCAFLLIEMHISMRLEETQMEKEQWTEPTVEEFDIAKETQLEPGGSGDTVDIGDIPGGS
jgi:hypothetical protein